MLRKKISIDQALPWVAAMVRNIDLFHELTPNIKNELSGAVKGLSQEASERGFLASLLSKKIICSL